MTVSPTRHGDLGRVAHPQQRVAAVVLATWSLAYVAPHLYWALGGSIGVFTVKPTASALPKWRAINAVASGVLVLPALIAWALVYAAGRVKAALLAACLVGAAISVGHGVYGIAYRALIVAGVVDVDGATFSMSEHGWVLWDLLVFEPWFFIEGLLFAWLGLASVPRSARRAWIVACVCTVALAVISGIAGLRV